ncbi:MAG TPA: putative sulfate exporter family transporter [Gaiellaceae bacterium]
MSKRLRRPLERGAVAAALVLACITAVVEPLGSLVPSIGAPALALILGMAIRARYAPDAAGRRVIGFASKTLLQCAIVLLGGTFGLGQVVRIGRSSLPLMLGTLAIALAAAWVIGRGLRVESTLTTLVGVGTAICGASAIGAVSGVVAATESEIAYAISTIFVFNVVAVLLYPTLGHVLSLSQHTFGLWAGTAVNDTSSVVAAAYAYGHTAGGVAVVTKLARTTMIIPVVLALALARARRVGAARTRPLWRVLPVFLFWFLVASALNTAGAIDPRTTAMLGHAASIVIAIALGAIGLSTQFAAIRHLGWRPLALGAALWAVVGLTGLLLQGVV